MPDICQFPFVEQFTLKSVISSERSESRNLHTFDTIFGHFSEKIPRFRFASLGMTRFLKNCNSPINCNLLVEWDL